MQNSDYMKGVVVDTGPLLIHAASIFENGRLLKDAVTPLKIPETEAKNLAIMIDRLFSTVKRILVTPYVLAEFCNYAQRTFGLKDNQLIRFMDTYTEFLLKLKEWQCEKDELIAFEKSLKLCFTDSSVAFASKRERIPLITIDGKLVEFCKSQGIEAKHIYFEIYLGENPFKKPL